jgi:hypothetical protein
MRVELERRRPPPKPEQQPKPQSRPERPNPTAPRPPVPALSAQPPTPAPHLAVAPPPAGAPSPWAVAPAQPGLPPGFMTSLQAHVGCASGELGRMNRGQREACARKLAEGAADAPFIPAPMAPEKRAAFDRAVRCRADYDDAPVPVGTQGMGLGYIPRLRDCGPKDH